jgi:D-amino-acid dehydrogenase
MEPASSVLIIGGGAIGLCTAYYLRERGVDVTLLDKGEIGHGCSLANAGLVAPSHFIPLAHPGVITQSLRWLLDPESSFYVKPRLDPELISWIWRFKRSSTREHVQRSMGLLRDLALESLRLFEALARLDDAEFELARHGLLVLHRTEKARSALVHEAELARRLGLRAVVLDRARLQALDPGVRFRAAGAVHFPDDAHISPSRFVQAMHGIVERRGAAIRSGAEVLGFETANGRVAGVRTVVGTFRAETIILAGGAWSPVLVRDIGIRLPLQAGKGYSITFEGPETTPSIPMLLTEARVAITPFGNSLRFAGTMELAGLDLSINHRRVDAILEAVPRYVEALIPGPSGRGEVWAGLRPLTPDGLPYVGRFKAYSNLIAATGHAMIGITLAPATGKLISEIVTGGAPSIDIRSLSPDRFGRR